MQYFIPSHALLVLTRITSSKPSFDNSAMGLNSPRMAAMLKMPSSPPKRSTARLTNASTSVAEPTSATTGSTSPGADLSSFLSSPSWSARRSTATTLTPRATSLRTAAAPSPRAAPVTITFCCLIGHPPSPNLERQFDAALPAGSAASPGHSSFVGVALVLRFLERDEPSPTGAPAGARADDHRSDDDDALDHDLLGSAEADKHEGVVQRSDEQ